MKIIVIGASGIIGQHMMVSVPAGVDAVFTSRTASPLHQALDLNDWPAVEAFLDAHRPNAIVNLAGENRPDVVERLSRMYSPVNVDAVERMAGWCDRNGVHLVQVSSQAVLDPVNAYGQQKLEAERLLSRYSRWTVVRPTFVLGIRPFPGVGRENPAERILSGKERQSVADRFFSASFAWDVANVLWTTAQSGPRARAIYVGDTTRLSRHALVGLMGFESEPVSHDSLPGLAPRPLDTTYSEGQQTTLAAGLELLRHYWTLRETDGIERRAIELAAFLECPVRQALDTLKAGFVRLHHAVTADFRRANPQSDFELLNWYRNTEAYLWELTAYHCDSGYNYAGMCRGIVERLKAAGARRVLCLGDGTGDLTLAVADADMQATYNDLAGSRIAAFAESRFFMRYGKDWSERISLLLSPDFAPPIPADVNFDAIVSLDFLEHVPNVEQWVRAIYASLRPGGLFCAQNAFNCGSGYNGAIPMHLSCNDRFEKDWDPTLSAIGFRQQSSNWYERPATEEKERACA
jgi:dTDP-4-dehydrorhamnose reductase/SAM-dependent methyltransferase